ncbi:hypothetical protein PhCBS80983_g02999 [Powellomyces hirtus]|uniref:Sulfide:quinone oxidoreductase, mitochondrial n=1 Tax=Powellomyces hirtus TaxID=109895 RepID=A0A507E3G5_9FUNG|nr:hypothetical protein DFJ77DRAFT_511271 [Powellomyces hirtus]TPX58613.1 hypothetical protein PhCBS80983_g02999 [Powellomyces hirtus]
MFSRATLARRSLSAASRRGLATVTTAKPNPQYKVVVIGGGSAGLAVAARVARDPLFQGKKEILVIDPSSKHYYQPLWTFVGAGLKKLSESEMAMGELIPKQADWLRESVSKVDPKNNVVVTNGSEIKYDFLVVAPGIKLDFEKIAGLKESLGRDGVTSNYAVESVEKTNEFIQAFKGGNAIFTQPATPIKCAGAPQKIAYLAEEIFRNKGIRDQTNVQFHSGMGKIFAIDKYAEELTKVCQSRDINVNLLSNLVEVRSDKKEAVFKSLGPQGGESIVKYDLLHVTPPMSAPAFIKESGIANADGWVDVNKETTQHTTYPNIFSLGDASGLPTSKTAAAAAAQSAVTGENLLQAIKSTAGSPSAYNGYTSCPLITGKGKLILAEFSGYTGKPLETFPFNQATESAFSYYLTSDIIPSIYWNGQVKGLWGGPTGIRKLTNPFNNS